MYVDQRVEPDVEDVRRLHRQRDAPLDGGAADREIVQPCFTNEITSLRRVSGWMKSGSLS